MADTSGDQPGKFKVTSPKYDRSRIKAPHLISMLPTDFYPVIGQVIVTWGSAEDYFNTVLAALRKGSPNPPEKTHSAFQKRADEFRALSAVCFEKLPTVASVFNSMATDIAALAIDRNLIVHGEIWVSSKNGGILIAKGRVRKKTIEKEFDLYALEQLFYDLSHVGGKFLSVTMMPATGGFFLPLPSHEKSALLDFCRTNLPTPPTQGEH